MGHRSTAGVTLIELMVAVVVLSILAVAAIPSFMAFRQRSALIGASDQLVSFWGDARFEALRRNVPVKVGFKTTSAGAICIGATTTDPNDGIACDCFTAGSCNVSSYPASQADWNGLRIPAQPTLGPSDSDDDGVAVIDPKRGTLTDRNDAGRLLLQGPTGNMDYRIDVVIDGNGRATQCEPAAAPSKIPAFTDRRC